MKIRKIMAIAGFILSIFAAPSVALADSYGAIAYSPRTGAHGWSHSFNSRRGAENAALDNCYQRAGDCRVAIWFVNACGAVAAGPRGWGSAWANNSNRAQRKALRQCSNYSGNCRIVRWQCSGAR